MKTLGIVIQAIRFTCTLVQEPVNLFLCFVPFVFLGSIALTFVFFVSRQKEDGDEDDIEENFSLTYGKNR